jgi:hypothetical protein
MVSKECLNFINFNIFVVAVQSLRCISERVNGEIGEQRGTVSNILVPYFILY